MIVAFTITACGSAAIAQAPLAPSAKRAPERSSASGAGVEAENAPATNAGADAAPAAPSVASPAPRAGAGEAPLTAGERSAREMLDIEAHLSLLVDDLPRAHEALHRTALARGATITSDVVDESGSPRHAALTLRVPAQASHDFIAALDGIGSVTARQVTAKDIGHEFHDNEIALHNMERTLARYEEILQQAHSVEEILKIEAELSRIRGEIDRLKGDLRYMSDRAARATVYVTLNERAKEIAIIEPAEEKFRIGARAVVLAETLGRAPADTSFGAGLVLGAGRPFNVEVDALKQPHSSGSGLDAMLATIGGDAYSDLLGGGKREFLNPFLGLRAGYARIGGANEFALGGDLGLELWKTKYATIDADLRLLGLFGKGPSELGAEPTFGANVAF